jgi:hypothetical protein
VEAKPKINPPTVEMKRQFKEDSEPSKSLPLDKSQKVKPEESGLKIPVKPLASKAASMPHHKEHKEQVGNNKESKTKKEEGLKV